MDRRLILDRYRPLAELGEGGHGSVVLAYDTRMARRVAIKRLPLPLDVTGSPVTRAGLAEARTAALLNHPDIVTVHEWDTDADEAFLIMEHVDGASLGELLDRVRGRLEPDEVAAIAEDIGRALAFAHDNGVLHLDIKPDNAIVTREGGVKVADFGIAQLTDVYGTAPGTSGTLGYMPPEQLANETVDERTDQWALAALLYRALTGAEAFDSTRVESALLASTLEAPRRPSSLLPSLDPVVDRVLLRALDPHPVERFDTVVEFTAELLPLLGDPAAGRESLAEIVEGIVGQEEAEEEPGPLGLWDRLLAGSGAFKRIGAAAACLWLSATALQVLPLGAVAAWGGTALVTLAAALAPGLGVALALLAVAAAAWTVAGPLVGVLALVFAAVLWWFVGRDGDAAGIVPLTAPFFGAASVGVAPPLVLGYAFRPALAAASGALAGLSLMAASAASGAPAPFLDVPRSFLLHPFEAPLLHAVGALAATPGAYVAVAGWAVASAVCSILCVRSTRPAALAGVAAGLGWLAVAYLVWSLIDLAVPFPGPSLLRHAAGSLILMALVIAAGPPARAEEE